MATTISAVTGNEIIHAVFISLELGGETHYLSTAERNHTINGNVYNGMFSLLSLGDLSEDFKATRAGINISINGIPDGEENYLAMFLTDKIKGGEVNIKRGFYNTTTGALDLAQVYDRFQGVISNYSVDEETGVMSGKATHTITLNCVPIDSILMNQMAGQFTNGASRRLFYPGDISFDRVQLITNKPLEFKR